MRSCPGFVPRFAADHLDEALALGSISSILRRQLDEKDLRDLDTSADRITKRGQRILDVDLGEEPAALPKP